MRHQCVFSSVWWLHPLVEACKDFSMGLWCLVVTHPLSPCLQLSCPRCSYRSLSPNRSNPHRPSHSCAQSLDSLSPAVASEPGTRSPQGRSWSGWGLSSSGSTHFSLSSQSRPSLSRDMSKNQFSLQLNPVTTEDRAVYDCARDTVKGTSV